MVVLCKDRRKYGFKVTELGIIIQLVGVVWDGDCVSIFNRRVSVIDSFLKKDEKIDRCNIC